MAVRQSEISKLHATFEGLRFTCEGVDAWSARDLMALLTYDRWENFRNAVDRAVETCRTNGKDPERHFIPAEGELDISLDRIFRGVTKKSGRGRPREEMILSRYGAYLVAMNGDTSKEPVAFAQEYFAVQTRGMEVLQQRLAEVERLEARRQLTQTEKDLSSALFNHGVDDDGFSIIRSRGDEALFGLSTKKMKERLTCGSAPLANRLPTVIIRAKDLAAEMTAYNTRANPDRLHGVGPIGDEHVKNNKNVRGALLASGIHPEKVKADEDTAKLERRHKKDHSKVASMAQELPRLTGPTNGPTPPATEIKMAAPTKRPTAKAMLDWFGSSHQPAVERGRLDDEGEYACPLVDIEDVLLGQFPTASDRVLRKVVEELELEGPYAPNDFFDALDDEAMAEEEHAKTQRT